MAGGHVCRCRQVSPPIHAVGGCVHPRVLQRGALRTAGQRTGQHTGQMQGTEIGDNSGRAQHQAQEKRGPCPGSSVSGRLFWADRAQRRWQGRWALCWDRVYLCPHFLCSLQWKKAAPQGNPENSRGLFKDAREPP